MLLQVRALPWYSSYMDIVIEVAANAAFIIGFFFGPALAVEAWKALKG